jgi:hypothetical protein
VVGIDDLPVHTIGRANGKLRPELDLNGLCSLLRKPSQIT